LAGNLICEYSRTLLSLESDILRFLIGDSKSRSSSSKMYLMMRATSLELEQRQSV